MAGGVAQKWQCYVVTRHSYPRLVMTPAATLRANEQPPKHIQVICTRAVLKGAYHKNLTYLQNTEIWF